MMESQVDRELLEKIADLIGKPVGAFNIRKDTGCDGRQSTENIQRGRISFGVPRWRRVPSPTTMTSSAKEIIRS